MTESRRCAYPACRKPLVQGERESKGKFRKRQCCQGTDCAQHQRSAKARGVSVPHPPRSEWKPVAPWPAGIRFDDGPALPSFTARIDRPPTETERGASSMGFS